MKRSMVDRLGPSERFRLAPGQVLDLVRERADERTAARGRAGSVAGSVWRGCCCCCCCARRFSLRSSSKCQLSLTRPKRSPKKRPFHAYCQKLGLGECIVPLQRAGYLILILALPLRVWPSARQQFVLVCGDSLRCVSVFESQRERVLWSLRLRASRVGVGLF